MTTVVPGINPTPTYEAIDRIFRNEKGRVTAALVARLRDLELAEDAIQDALISALERWPIDGVPHNPGAWLTTAAQRKAIDRLRRAANYQQKQATIQAIQALEQDDDAMDPTDEAPIPDERLKLIFTCCHPAIAKEAQVALTLHTLGGLTTPEIAAAFLTSEPTMAQRIVRAKRKIRDAGIPYQVPPLHLLPERVDSVLSALYLIFNAGYTAPIGASLVRSDLCAEAIRLTRVLNALLSAEPALGEDAEALGLLALMLLHHARYAARADGAGGLIRLEDQDRALWDRAAIDEGLDVLDHALKLRRPGPYQIQAAIAALHAQAPAAEATDWRQIAGLYGILLRHMPSPVVQLNFAVAMAMAEGVQEGMRILDDLEEAGTLDDYYLFHAARADLLFRSGWYDEALTSYRRALALCQNAPEQAFLSRQIARIEAHMAR
jgi:RNA polymerase sigma-70 factor (ECF subfamily)